MYSSSCFKGKIALPLLMLFVVMFAFFGDMAAVAHAATSPHALHLKQESSQSSTGNFDIHPGEPLVLYFSYPTCDVSCGNETWYTNNIPPNTSYIFEPPTTTGSNSTKWTFQSTKDTPLGSYTLTIGATSDNPNVKLGSLDITINVRGRLFIFLQGLTSSLSQNAFWDTKSIGPFLQTTYSDANFLTFSYHGSDKAGNPDSYGCIDTFNQNISTYVKRLNSQIQRYLTNRPNTDVDLIGHSMGGVIAIGYLAYLDKTSGLKGYIPGTPGGKIQGVVTLDSPLGGIEKGPLNKYFDLVSSYYRGLPQCSRIKNTKVPLTSLRDLTSLYTFYTPRGGQASISQVLFNSRGTNENLLRKAEQDGTASLTIGNLIDFVYDARVCVHGVGPEFLDSQWDLDQGNNSGVYARAFIDGTYPCTGGNGIGDNHGIVFVEKPVQTGLQQFLDGNTPTDLAVPPN
ncbi:MAG: hypothetical protein JO202_04610 [Ktedonobacteraceae bacterium]|nr:hypothetical protein [Ktedonobacteraceae bacterium]